MDLQCSCDFWKQVRKRLFQNTFAWKYSKRLVCSGLSKYPAKKCLTYCVWSQEDGGEWAGCASSRLSEFFHKGSCQQSAELYLPFLILLILFIQLKSIHPKVGSDSIYLFNVFKFQCFQVLQSHYALVDFSPLLSHLLNNFKTRVLQLNLTRARGLKNTYVLTSSRKIEHI